jgi:hypothetical protein
MKKQNKIKKPPELHNIPQLLTQLIKPVLIIYKSKFPSEEEHPRTEKGYLLFKTEDWQTRVIVYIPSSKEDNSLCGCLCMCKVNINSCPTTYSMICKDAYINLSRRDEKLIRQILGLEL